jgi:hypothetical protein
MKSHPVASKNLFGNSQSNVNNNIAPEVLQIMKYLNNPAGHHTGSIITVDIIKKIEDFQSWFSDIDDDFFENVRETIFDILVELTHDNPEYVTSDSVFFLKQSYELFKTFGQAKKEFLSKEKESLA